MIPGVANVSAYERLQIESLLQPVPPPPIDPGTGLAMFSMADGLWRRVYEVAVAPALRAAGLNREEIELAFNERSSLATLARTIQMAEVVVADLSDLNPSLMYAVGLAHALGRCPILLATSTATELPFNLQALRHLRYSPHHAGLMLLREELTRTLRVFRAAASNS